MYANENIASHIKYGGYAGCNEFSCYVLECVDKLPVGSEKYIDYMDQNYFMFSFDDVTMAGSPKCDEPEPETRRKSETIHSGHFMVSDVHDKGYDFSKATTNTFKDYNFVAQKAAASNVSQIDASLSRLFECLTIAFSGKVVSPKWKTFKGMKLSMKDKIRLNNAIWRAWHIQFKQNKNPIVCQFATPHTDHVHASPQAVVIEGKYWKRTLETVVQEYKRWRVYYKERNDLDCIDEDLQELKNHEEFLERLKESENSSRLFYPIPTTSTVQPVPSPMLVEEQDLLNEFTDTLFSSLNQPFAFPNPREIDFLEKIQNSASNAPPGMFVFMGNNYGYNGVNLLQDNLLQPQQQQQQQQQQQIQLQSQQQIAGGSGNMGFQSQFTNLPGSLDDAINSLASESSGSVQQQQSLSLPCSPVSTSAPQQFVSGISIPSTVTSSSMMSQSAMASSPPCNLAAALAMNLPLNPLAAQIAQAIQLSQPTTTSNIQAKPVTFRTVATQPSSLLSQTPPVQTSKMSSFLPANLNFTSQPPLQQVSTGSFTLPQQQLPQEVQTSPGLTYSTIDQTQSQMLSLFQPTLINVSADQNQTFTQTQTQQPLFSPSDKKPTTKDLLAQSRTPSTAAASLTFPSSTISQPSQILQELNQLNQSAPAMLQPIVATATSSVPPTTTATVTRTRRGSGGSSQSSPKNKISPMRPKQPINIAPAPPPSISTAVSTPNTVNTSSQASNNTFLAQLLTTGNYPGRNMTVHQTSSSQALILQPIKTEFSSMPTACALVSSTSIPIPTTQPNFVLASASGSQLSDLPSGSLLVSTEIPTKVSSAVNVKLSSSTTSQPEVVTTSTPSTAVKVSDSASSYLISSKSMITDMPKSIPMDTPEEKFSLADEEPNDSKKANHQNAEQKRRVNIKAGFDTLQTIIPALVQNPNQKISKAAMLQKAVDYTNKLKHERTQRQNEAALLRREIDSLNAAINETQAKLPATGVPVTKQRFDQMRDMFDDYVRTRTGQNWKFWIFSIIIRPLFESYNGMVSTASIDELCRTVLAWSEQHCALTALRPSVLPSLTQLSTTTSILSDPSLVPEQAAQAVKKQPGNQ
uniref:MLX-interacting protein-like n=1 Tax=Saccoglossus kowalevskii TaxID=10224 RepID=A0ABM0MDK2_SACKO|nr:PREDICTED: MLX-interacting protein-like [Saccoglossus kowalevskii]